MAALHIPVPDAGPGNQPPPCIIVEADEGAVYLDLRQIATADPGWLHHVPLDASQARAVAAALWHFATEETP